MNLRKAVFALLVSVGLVLCAPTLMHAEQKPLGISRQDLTLAHYNHRAWRLVDGAPPDIWALAQAPDGFLWLGSGSGIYRFDGLVFEEIRLRSGQFPSSNATALLIAPDGAVWIGYFTGEISRLHDGRMTNFSHSDSVVEQLAQDRDGSIWAARSGTHGGLFHFDGKRWKRIGKQQGVSGGTAYSVLVARDGTVVVATESQVLMRRPHGVRFEVVGNSRGVSRLAEAPDGKIWVSGDVRRTTRAAGMPGFAVVPGSASPTDRADRMIFSHDGSLWQTNFGGGVARIGRLSSPGAAPMIERFMPEDGLTSPVAVPVLEDREGNIWIGTNVGLNRLRPVSAVTVLKVGEDSARTFRLTAANDGIVYVASGRMLYRVVPEGDLELLRKLPEPVGFLEADGQDLVIGQGNSIVRLAKGSIVRPRYPPAPSEIVSWGADAQGQIWITADNFGGYRLSPGGWVAASLADQKLAGRFVFSHTVTKSSDWLYAQDHLLRRVGPLFETVTTKGPGIGHITIVSEGRSGPLVGGELGLARLGRSHFQTISAAREPALRGISGILQTPDCEVWINGVRGLLRTTCDDLKIAFDDPGKRLRYKQFSAADGLPGVAQQNGNGSTLTRGGDGRIWIANNLGVAWIDPARTITNRLPPPVQIRKLEANGRIFADVDRVELPAGTRDVRIAYVAPSLAASERIIFRYKLVGVDRDWVEAGTRRDAFYANLPAGKWQFQVIAANNDGVWNKQGDSLSISIAPQYYETTWFRLLCIVLVLATVWLLYNWRVRQHRSHARDLAEAQLGERERIARELHDTLLQGVQGLMLRFQAATNAMSPGSREHVLAERALERADDLIIQARDRVRGLRARERSGELVSLMEELAAQYRSDGLSVSISFQDRLEPLAPELAEQVLAIVAEALANILHHAQASEVTIEIDRGRTHQTVVITDDGIGFPIEVIADSGRAGHFGIQGMMERANAFGGWLRIENSAELGARVVLGIRLSPFKG
ncbi:hypothetical protein K3177_13385 [Qipengyuania sp. GH25]|uniref:Histidine kinase/HSP90-like ATPase domain-containing protein n=1 Tax=Qipengyuania pacifica TaxID=2860199 RepID=A0ABS7JHM3_9SPHN|nr:sensor histidine kinase [Qipengyuania aerophila]MBX7489509.1 hypothetical protein [Qipengyuania aerophila]